MSRNVEDIKMESSAVSIAPVRPSEASRTA